MTRAQELIRLYICKRFQLDKIQLQNIGTDTVQITDGNGETMRFTMNVYGDILDADTGKIIANSNGTHDLDAIRREPEQMPTDWKDNYSYFNR